MRILSENLLVRSATCSKFEQKLDAETGAANTGLTRENPRNRDN